MTSRDVIGFLRKFLRPECLPFSPGVQPLSLLHCKENLEKKEQNSTREIQKSVEMAGRNDRFLFPVVIERALRSEHNMTTSKTILVVLSTSMKSMYT